MLSLLKLTVSEEQEKGICAYHKDNFDALKKKEQQALFEHHDTNLVVYN